MDLTGGNHLPHSKHSVMEKIRTQSDFGVICDATHELLARGWPANDCLTNKILSVCLARSKIRNTVTRGLHAVKDFHFSQSTLLVRVAAYHLSLAYYPAISLLGYFEFFNLNALMRPAMLEGVKRDSKGKPRKKFKPASKPKLSGDVTHKLEQPTVAEDEVSRHGRSGS